MINEKSILACQESHFGTFGKPLYDSYCFSRIPGTIQKLLGIASDCALPEETVSTGEKDFVILILLDAFGWMHFERYKEQFPFLQRFIKEGKVSKLTSQFPSTTTAHITCLHTGLPVGVTGLYEWFCYDPIVGRPITPLRFSYAKDRKINTLLEAGFDPKILFPLPTIYETLKKEGIDSYIFQPKDITNTPYSTVLQRGAESRGYKRLREGLNHLARCYLETKSKKAYYFFYYPEIDSYGHEFGLHNKHMEKEITNCFTELERFIDYIQATKPNTACIVTADHGMVDIDPKETLYLNLLLPDLEEAISKDSRGEPIVPCGSCRDFFMHIKPELLHKTKKTIEECIKGKAAIYTTEELIENGLFGTVEKRFLERVGNLVILPHAPYSVWWYKEGRFENHYHGHHGGLSKEELEIPFLFKDL